VTQRPLRNVAASVHQRLLNVAKASSRPFGEVLQYFAMERFLYRLSQSAYAENFVLKGALLFRVWDLPDSRATRDIDFLAYLDNSPQRLAEIVREICGIEDADDGLVFEPESVNAMQIKEDTDYAGVRVRFRGRLGNARIHMQMDVGFGDPVQPDAVPAEYPVILDLPAPSLRIYPPETVIAEKVQTMVYLGALNSRMKDFYDVWRMSQQFDFDGAELSDAMSGTFAARKTDIVGFDDIRADVLQSDEMERQWRAFLAKANLQAPDQFGEVLELIGDFLAPIFRGISAERKVTLRWIAPGPWR
jgi:predicted nucleotidyltransferase component of viral defense system